MAFAEIDDFFDNAPPDLLGGRCFVAMPYTDLHLKVYEEIESALREDGLKCSLAKQAVHGGPIMTDVLEGLARAGLVIVDLTGNNPNVLYELGLAHARRCSYSILLITQDVKTLPFDLKHLRCVEYTPDPEGYRVLREHLRYAVSEKILASRYFYRWSENPEGKLSDPYPGVRRKLYRFKISNVVPALDAAEFSLTVFQVVGGVAQEVNRIDQCLLRTGAKRAIPLLSGWAVRLDIAIPDREAEFCACKAEG